MIRLACTNCREVLTIDDAFAGGVCRCQHCGTIQTVPATSSAAANEVVAGGPNLGGGRNGSVYGGAGAHSGTGLDDLAGAVASSGLSSSRLRRPDGSAVAPAARPAPAAKRPNLVPVFAAAGVVIVGLIGAVVYLATRSAPVPAVAVDRGTQTVGRQPAVTPAAVTGPSFCGTPLAGDTVVYVLDRGSATQEMFAPLKDAALRSAASLGSGRHFQIVFWDNTGNADAPDTAAYPPVGTTYATKENVEAARRQLDDVNAFGQTDVKPALTLALSQHPDTVVIATAKGADLDDAWAAAVVAARGPSPAKLDTFSLGRQPEGVAVPPLKAVAQQTGGTYVEVSPADLKAAAD